MLVNVDDADWLAHAGTPMFVVSGNNGVRVGRRRRGHNPDHISWLKPPIGTRQGQGEKDSGEHSSGEHGSYCTVVSLEDVPQTPLPNDSKIAIQANNVLGGIGQR
jgi:hypothetical protein